MKFLICFLLILLPHLSFGVTLEKYFSSPEGSHLISFDLSDKKLMMSKNSNYFDSHHLSVGTFTASVQGQKKRLKFLEELLKRYETVDSVLRQKGSSFNEHAKPKGHEVIFRLNGFVITPASEYFDKVDKEFSELKKLKWSQIEGYEISKDFKTVKEFKDGKVMKSSDYNTRFYCKKSECTFYGGGTILR